MEFRPASAGDIEAIANLHAESWRRHYRGAYRDEFLDGEVYADRRAVWTDRLSAPSALSVTLVAVDGAVEGFVHVVVDDDPEWGSLIDNLHVSHGAKRRGIGRELMTRAATESLPKATSRRIYLWVLEQNHNAQAFYKAVGGEYAGREEHTAQGGGTIIGLRYAWPDGGKLATAAGPRA